MSDDTPRAALVERLLDAVRYVDDEDVRRDRINEALTASATDGPTCPDCGRTFRRNADLGQHRARNPGAHADRRAGEATILARLGIDGVLVNPASARPNLFRALAASATDEQRHDHIAWARHVRSEHEATHGEAEQCGEECVVLGLTEFEDEGPPEGTRLVLFTEELALALGADRVEWGEPDEHGWYTPTLSAASATDEPGP